jgi:FMN-dependent NADH-azoreductase
MASILHINSSVRNQGSVSREVTGEFLKQWKTAHPDGTVVERDLTANPVPHLNEKMLGAFFTAADQRTPEQAEIVKLSDELVAELFAADVIVIGAPMYNFSISSTLKAWIDHVARAGVTFKYTESGPVGLVQEKKVYVCTSRGGVYSEGPGQSMDFHGTYLRGVLGFIGLNDITFIHTEGLALGEDTASKALTNTRTTIGELTAV